MCGRFTLHSRLNLLLQQFAIEAAPELAPRYNIAPTQEVPVVRNTNATRELVPLKWGLVPFWAEDPKIGNRMINARGETVAGVADQLPLAARPLRLSAPAPAPAPHSAALRVQARGAPGQGTAWGGADFCRVSVRTPKDSRRGPKPLSP